MTVLDVGPSQVILIHTIRFYSQGVNKTARDCVINEWFCRTVFNNSFLN